MDRATMLSELTDVLNDSPTNGVWSQSQLLRYLSEGQDKFCEETGFFRDSSTFTITLVSGTSSYDIPDRIIQIIDVVYGTKLLTKIATGANHAAPDYTTEFDFSQTVPGMPTHWQTELTTGKIDLYPTPGDDQAGEVLTLRVWRYSLYDLADTGKEPEISSRFHRACVEWAAYKAFNHHDMETQDPVKAADHLNAFRMYVSDGRRALSRYHNQEVTAGCGRAYVC